MLHKSAHTQAAPLSSHAVHAHTRSLYERHQRARTCAAPPPAAASTLHAHALAHVFSGVFPCASPDSFPLRSGSSALGISGHERRRAPPAPRLSREQLLRRPRQHPHPTPDTRHPTSRRKKHTPVELLEGSLGPDDEAAKVATGSKLEEVEAVDARDLHARDVAEALLDAVVAGVHEEGALALDIAPVPHLAGTAADLLRVLDVLNVLDGLDVLEERERLLGLAHRLDLVRDHEGDLLHGGNAVAAGHEERGHRRGGERRAHRDAALVVVGLGSPLAPLLGGVEHAAATALVAEGTLAGAVGTATADTGDTRHGAASAPRDGRLLHTGLHVDAIRLAVVLVEAGVHAVHDVLADGGHEDIGQRQGAHSLLLSGGVDRHDGTCGGHFGESTESSARERCLFLPNFFLKILLRKKFVGRKGPSTLHET